jgi:photosystem II stability/assembly factor-like uncharacterized protein
MNFIATQTSWLLRAVVLVLFVAVSANAQQGWVLTRVAPASQDLNTVFFLDDKRGWVGGDNGFLSRTDDGGHTWVQQVVETKAAVNDIYFRDKEDGFLIAGNAVFITRDKGNRWTEVRRFLPTEFDGADVELYSVRFPTKKKGWIVGSVSRRDTVVDSILLYTENAGETWQRQRAPSRLELIHIEFVNEKRGWIVGAAGTILATVDAGETWTKQDTGTTSTIYHVDFRNDKKGIAVGERGTILRTINGGTTWTAIPPKTSSTLLNVEFVSDDNGWAVGRGGVILRTEDAGANWIEQETGTKLNLYGLHFAKKIGWAVGADGTLLRYER